MNKGELTMDYQLALKNEVYVNSDNLKHLFDKYEVFVVGYGSLLYSSGWKGRGMAAPPKKKDLIECTVDGFERGHYGCFCLHSKGWKSGLHYYGVVPDETKHINGVLARIRSLNDWANLMYTECIAGFILDYNYRVVDVTDNIRGVKLKKNQIVHMVVNELKNKHNWSIHSPAEGYYTKVAKGVKKERSLEFQRTFFKTGGITEKQASKMYKAELYKEVEKYNKNRYYR
jgi:hypothetical protein